MNPLKQATINLLEWCIDQGRAFTEETALNEASKVATCYELNDWERRALLRAARSFTITAQRLGTWSNFMAARHSFLLEAATFTVPDTERNPSKT